MPRLPQAELTAEIGPRVRGRAERTQGAGLALTGVLSDVEGVGDCIAQDAHDDLLPGALAA